MLDRAFIELKFSESVITIIDNFINEIIPENMLYSSPVVDHIRGNMSKTLHCTVLFGLDVNTISNIKLRKILKRNEISKLKLGSLSLINGYENLYKVLIINILDEDSKLDNFYRELEDFAIKKVSDYKIREFKPHLTLAYVNNNYQLPSELPRLPEYIDVEETRISLVSEFNKSVNS